MRGADYGGWRMLLELRKKVALNIKRARVQNGLTQERAAELSGFHYKYYQKIESGHVNLTLDSIQKIGLAFHIPTESLFTN